MSRLVREHFLCRLGLSGEILSMNAKDRAPAPARTSEKELRRMRSDNLIRYYRHDDKKRTYRICDPGGLDAIESVDPRLRDHAELMIGSKGQRYPGNKIYRLKKRKESMLINAMIDAGITVDGVTYGSGRFGLLSPTLTDANEIFKAAPPDRPLYVTGPILKKSAPGMQHSWREMSTSPGTIFSANGIITAYIIGTARYRWYAASELQSAMEIRRMWETVKRTGRKGDKRLKALIYAEGADIISELITLCGNKNSSTNPTSIYRLCYCVPLDDEQHAMDVTKMLAVPDWKYRTNEVLGLVEENKSSDGVTKDGKPIHNLLCCNIGRIQELSSSIKRGKCRLVIHDWQKEMLENLYETELDAMVLSPLHFRGLLIAVTKR